MFVQFIVLPPGAIALDFHHEDLSCYRLTCLSASLRFILCKAHTTEFHVIFKRSIYDLPRFPLCVPSRFFWCRFCGARSPLSLGLKKLNRTLTYLSLFLALLASLLVGPAFAQSLVPANALPARPSGLTARALQEFAGFHFHSAERLFVSALAQTSGSDDQLEAIEIMQKLARTH